MRIHYSKSTGEIMLISIDRNSPVTSLSPHPYIDVEMQDVNNKKVNLQTKQLENKS